MNEHFVRIYLQPRESPFYNRRLDEIMISGNCASITWGDDGTIYTYKAIEISHLLEMNEISFFILFMGVKKIEWILLPVE